MFADRPILSQQQREEQIRLLIDQMSAWNIPDSALDKIHDASRKSLDEVKALTEYEDGKASRLLTIIAFLSAVVAAVFTRFATDYVWPGLSFIIGTPQWLFPTATYVAFFAYVIIVTWATLSVLSAIKPQFNLPATWTDGGRTGRPTSMIFYKGILDVGALSWGQAFIELGGDNGKTLKAYYAKNYIVEAYLVAEKVAEKLAALKPGIKLLQAALVILVTFFVLFGATILTVDPTRSPTDMTRPLSIQK